jgi:predicted GIY-YIG superfamily endonuclease
MRQTDKVYIYQLMCSDGRYFTNVTQNITYTLARHYTGQVVSTRDHLPVRLVYLQPWLKENTEDIEVIKKRLRRNPGVPTKGIPMGLPVNQLYEVEKAAYKAAAELGTSWKVKTEDNLE